MLYIFLCRFAITLIILSIQVYSVEINPALYIIREVSLDNNI